MIYFSFYTVPESLLVNEGVVAGGRMSNTGEPVDLRLPYLPWTSCSRDNFTLKHRNLIKFSVDICFYYMFFTTVISVVYATEAYKPVRFPPYLYNRSSKLVRTLFPLLYLDLVRRPRTPPSRNPLTHPVRKTLTLPRYTISLLHRFIV